MAFTPLRLKEATEYISHIHSNECEAITLEMKEHLKALVTELASLDSFRIRKRAMILSEREVLLIAGYLPGNEYAVRLSNLFAIYEARASKDTAEALFKAWQQNYSNRECNQFICSLLDTDETFLLLCRKNNLSGTVFRGILESGSIPDSFGRMAYAVNDRLASTFKEKLLYFGVREHSKLYDDCAFLFFTFCGRTIYLKANKEEILSLVFRYEGAMLKNFVNNFVSVLFLRELLYFREIADRLNTRIGETNTGVFNAFFSDISPEIKQKYLNWMNLYRIDEYFGEDERSNFWKQYQFVSVRRYPDSNAAVLEFSDYYALEFLGQIGPIYIYPKEIFESRIASKLRNYDNASLRSMLYSLYDEKRMFRKIHSGDWQKETNKYLIRNKITQKIRDK